MSAELKRGKSLQLALAEVRDLLKEQLPALKTCRTYRGLFDTEQAKKTGFQVPALFVSVLGTAAGRGIKAAHTVSAPIQFGAVAVHRSATMPNGDEDDPALSLAELVEGALYSIRPERSGNIEDVEWSNAFDNAADRMGLALYVFRWESTVTREGDMPDACELADLLTIAGSVDLNRELDADADGDSTNDPDRTALTEIEP